MKEKRALHLSAFGRNAKQKRYSLHLSAHWWKRVPVGDTLYTEEQKSAFKQEISWKSVEYGVNKDGTPKIKYIKTVKDHYFERLENGKYRRHSFYKITLEDTKS